MVLGSEHRGQVGQSSGMLLSENVVGSNRSHLEGAAADTDELPSNENIADLESTLLVSPQN